MKPALIVPVGNGAYPKYSLCNLWHPIRIINHHINEKRSMKGMAPLMPCQLLIFRVPIHCPINGEGKLNEIATLMSC